MITSSEQLMDRIADTETPPVIIAEVGYSHGGSYDKALMLYEQLKEHCDLVKFQHHSPKLINEEYDPEHAYRFKQLRLRSDVVDGLCNLPGVFFSVHDTLAMLDLHDVIAWKIGSGENNDFELIRTCLATGKPVIISLGMGQTVEELSSFYCSQVIHMHCVSSYPTTFADMNTLQSLLDRFPRVGYSDHTIGEIACLDAVLRGARLIEKHVVLEDGKGRDKAGALAPSQFEQFSANIRAAHWHKRQEMQCSIDRAPRQETLSRIWGRKAFYAINDLDSGTILDVGMFQLQRPAPPGAISIDTPLSRLSARGDIKSGDLLTYPKVLKH